jgi:hypothetical protein
MRCGRRLRAMNKGISIVGLLLVVMAGCKSARPAESATANTPMQSVVPAPTAPSVSLETDAAPATSGGSPKFGWKQYDQENFATGPSQGRVFDVPLHSTRLRVKLSATQPVFAGVMTREQLSKGKGVVRAANFLSLPCGVVGRSGGERECSLDPMSSEVFVLRDVREQVMMVDPRVRPGENRISATLSVWACVADCKPVGGAR